MELVFVLRIGVIANLFWILSVHFIVQMISFLVGYSFVLYILHEMPGLAVGSADVSTAMQLSVFSVDHYVFMYFEVLFSAKLSDNP